MPSANTPQTENGFTKIADEILDALVRYRIPGEQRQCLDFVLRKTYGYNKKSDRISNSQFVEATGLDKANVCRSVRELSKKQLIIKNDNTNPPTYQFNKDYTEWVKVSKKTTVVNNATAVVKSDNGLLSKVTDTIDRKDNLQKIKKEKVKKEKLTTKISRPDWFPVQDWKDMMDHRKAKKAANTDRAIKIVIGEFEKAVAAGLDVGKCVDVMVSRQWVGFQAEWVLKMNGKNQASQDYNPFAGAK